MQGTQGYVNSLVNDPVRKHLLAFPKDYGEPWELDYRSLRTPQHHPRPGETLRADLSLPDTPLGTPIVFALSGAEYPSTPLPAAISDAAALPLAPDALLSASLAAGLWQRLWPTHRISLEVRLPRTRSLVDTEIFAAAMVLSPTGRISRTTNNVGFRIVP